MWQAYYGPGVKDAAWILNTGFLLKTKEKNAPNSDADYKFSSILNKLFQCEIDNVKANYYDQLFYSFISIPILR